MAADALVGAYGAVLFIRAVAVSAEKAELVYGALRNLQNMQHGTVRQDTSNLNRSQTYRLLIAVQIHK